MTVTTGWCVLLVAWAVLITPPVGTLLPIDPPPDALPALEPVEVIRQRGVQRRAAIERILALQEAELERMRLESKAEDAAMAKSTALYHYTCYRSRAIDLNRYVVNSIRRTTGFRLPNAAELLPVLK